MYIIILIKKTSDRMKIAIVSDLHLGYDLFREDAFNQAKQALDMAYELSDMLLVPGDVFDVHYPRPDVIAEAVNLFGAQK